MDIRTLEVRDTGNEMLCKGLMITNIESFDRLMRLYDQYSKEYSDDTVLLSLDDLGQSQYTSMHAAMAHDLDDTDGHDLSRVDPCAFEQGEHIGYLSTQSEFFIREENFKRLAQDVSFEDACSRGLDLADDELATLERIHAEPELALDEHVVAWIVPVRDPSLALCASPNGYFSPDLNPFENYALASYLNKKYGYVLFGIGASIIGFRRPSPLHEDAAQSLARDLARLYNCTENQEKARRLLDIVQSRDLLFLKYTESLEIS